MEDTFDLETVDVALSPLERFEEFAQSRGLRVTKQRKLIIEHVFARHEHFDAEELLAQLQSALGKSAVSRATVYRALEELVDAGLLRKMALGGRTIFEHDYGYPQHDHMYCQKCEKLIEFSSAQVQALREAVAREHQFRVRGHRLIIYGVCAECSRPRRRNRPVDLV